MHPHVVCLGEILIDFVSTASGCSLDQAPAFEKAAGGAPANVAAGVARLGASAAFLGKVGDDPFGTFLIGTMKACGVDTTGMVRDRDARTTLAFVSLTAGGERDFVFYRNPGADERYSVADLTGYAESLVREARIFHFGSISMTAEPARSATLRAAEIAKGSGKLVSFDPNVRRNLWPDDAALSDAIAAGARLADILKVSEEEVRWLPAGLTPRLLLITKGPGGCTWKTPSGTGDVPGFAVSTVDTTGAGDAFLAAILTQLAESRDLIDDPVRLPAACRFANAAGALATTSRGAIPSLPDRPAIERFLANRS